MRHEINPFIDGLLIEVNKVVDADTVYLLERDRSVKVYRTIENRDTILRLSGMGCKMFTFITFRLEPGKDTVILKPETYMELCNVKSEKTFYNAIQELIQANIIAKVSGKKSTYYINPSFMFFGSRIKAFPDKIQVTHTYKRPQ